MRHWLFILFIFFPFLSFSQCPTAINVNLTSSPSASFSNSYSTIGPMAVPNTCCPNVAVPSERCIKFSITLHPNAGGIRFEMNPTVNSGVYRIGCSSTPVNVGSAVCLQGPGPHILTFCNTSQITSLFKITSLPKPTAGPDISISQGCSRMLNAGGFDSTAVTWTAVPTNAVYNSYLSCTNCLKPTVTPGSSPPPYVDYKICGTSFCGSSCDTVRVFFTSPLSVTITPPNPAICNNQTPNSTTITATGSGGSGSYSYLWNNINTSPTITVPAGYYTVVLSDGAGCSASAIVEVKKFTVPVAANAGPDKTVCKQNPTTTLNGTVQGAYGGLWSGGAGIFSPNNAALNAAYTPTPLELAAGFADLTLTTTGNGTCTAASDIVRINYDNFTGVVSVTPTAISCYGGNNGSATVNITGGSPPHTYSWNTVPAQTTATAANLSLGTYSVTVTNSIGCTSTTTAVITQPASIALASSIAPVTCPGGNNGSVSITATGGTPPFSYLWQPGGQTTAAINGKQAGTYSVTVTDSKGCPQQANYTIVQPSAIAISFTPTPVFCYNGNDGKAVSNVSGGTPPYSYNWSSGATSPDATGLQAGTYTLTVTDFLGCSAAYTVVITQPAPFTANTITINESCNYLNDGSATVNATGGNPNYTYLWQPGSLTSATINNLASGTYTVTATDNKGCTATSFATINEPAPLTINFISQINVSCFGGNDGFVTASPSGGTPPCTYLWSPGGATTSSRNNLQAGTYTATITDTKGCTSTNSVIITEPSAPLSISNATVTDASCNGGNNGSIAVTPAGGTSPYIYLWQPGNKTTATIDNLTAGTYTLTLKDSKGCQIITNYTVNQPAPTNISFTSTPVSCINGNDGAITTSIAGGNPPYTYSWMPGAETTNSLSSKTAGTYTLTVTDSKGCSTSNTVTITQPPPISLNPTITNVVCSGGNSGAIALAPSGGNSPYTYLWSQGNQTTSSINNLTIGTYTVTVTDATGCQTTVDYTITQLSLTITLTPTHISCFGGNNGTISALPSGGTPNFSYSWAPGGATTNSIINLSAGTYTLTITDSKGCIAQNWVTITQPTPLSVSATSTDKTCSNLNNGTTAVTPSGGTPGYIYLWQPGLQTTNTITGLSAGTYTVNVKDAKGCTTTATTIVGQPAPLIANFTGQTNVTTCYGDNNGSVTANPSGGTSPYSYLWMPGNTTTSTISNLMAGTYSLTVTDNKGCTANNSVTITQPPQLSATTTKTNETCNYLNNGTASVTATGGTPIYTYSWQPGGLTNNSISGLSAATYTVTVTDSKGCITTKTAIVTEPATLTVNFTGQTNVSCSGGSNGVVSSSISGGTANYTYSWAPGGATTANRNNLAAGAHTLTVTDAKGCTATNTVTVTQPAPLTVTTTNTNETCSYSNNGTATAIPSGGTPGYTYSWQPGLQTTVTKTGMTAGTYTITVKDTKGCSANATVVITEPPVLAVSFTSQINISCNGGNNGTVTASPTGGTPGYTYLWSPGGATTATRTNLTAGTYSVTVKDSKGCTVTKAVAITQPTVLLATMTRTHETCNYLNNGTATVNPSGGTAPYTYLWSPGSMTTKTVTSLSAGVYTVVITDAKGCTLTRGVTVNEPLPLTITFTNQTNVSCFGGNDGAVAASISGGTLNYTYLWTPGGGATDARYNLAAGTYSLTVSDYWGCSTTNSVIITQPPPFSVSAASTPATCTGINDGSLSSSALGGTAPYTYKWVPGSYTGQSVSSVAAGTYSVIATDSNGCTASNPVIVTQPDSILLTYTTTNSGCNLATGSATIAASGGFPPYSYLWSTGETGTSANNLFAGSYTVTVTDSQGCNSTNYVNVNDDSVPTLTILSTNVACIGDSTGSATVNTTGGSGTPSYLWTPSGQTGITASSLAAGVYTVRVITSPNGCKAFESVTITEPTQISLNISKTNVSCYGSNNGTATVTAYGGTPGYTYLWLPGGFTDDTITNLSANTYTVQVKDSNNCISQTSSTTVTITQPTTPMSVSTAATAAVCYGKSNGTISASAATGGSGGPYNYIWNPGNLNGLYIARLPAATYTLTVTDAKGCTKIDSAIVTQPPLLTTSFINKTNVSCYGGNNGSVTASPSGGTPGYTYYWIPGGLTTAAISNLSAGVDSVTIVDFNGCAAAGTTTITQPTALSINIVSTDETCDYLNNGKANVTGSGGTSPYTYLWQPGSFTTDSISNLSEGTYSVTVTDNSGCAKTETATITEPALLGISFINQTEVSCFAGNDGAVMASISGGTPSYTYSWMPGSATTAAITNLSSGTYTLTVQDSNSCLAQTPVTITQPASPVSATYTSTPVSCYGGDDGTLTSTAAGGTAPYNFTWMPGNYNGENLSNLTAGTYTVTVTDANGCAFIDSVTVTQAPLLLITTSGINSDCSQPNGQAIAIVSGGTSPYSYEWQSTGGTNSTATGLLAGTYTVSVTDNNACNSTMSVTINDNPAPTAVVSASTNIDCYGASNGSATVSATGNFGPFTYSWSPAGGTNSVATGLAPGTYTVIVTDTNSCQSQAAVSPEITEPPPILAILNQSSVSCFGGNDASASVIGAGGTPGYNYLWLPGGTTNTTVNNLSSTTYTIQITDANNCIQTTPFTIEQPSAPLSVSLTSDSVVCFGESNGAVYAAVTGGSPPYNYFWMPGNLNGQNLSNLAAGSYTVTIIDSKGCSIIDSVVVSQPDILALTSSSINSNCSLPNGQASVSVTGGIVPYTYQWQPSGDTNAIETGLTAGSYTVTVTDNNACFSTTSITVNDNPSPAVSISSTTNVSCYGGADGAATATVSGNGPFTYSWLPSGGTSATAAGLIAGTYTLTVMDVNLCQSVPTVNPTITEPDSITITVTTGAVSCFGQSNVNASTIASGGTPGYTYLWLPGGTTGDSIANLSANTYTIQVTDNNNCVKTSAFTITEPTQLTASISSVTNVSCFGENNGEATVTTNGGTPVYSYNWQPSGGNGPTEQGLPVGTYTVTVTDYSGCTAIDSVIITQPASALSATSTSSSITCFGASDGTATINSSGGTPVYSYQWNPSVSATNTASGLSSGIYTILVTDTKGCETNIAVNIAEPTALNGTLAAVNPSCSMSNGSIDAQVSGGTSPYIYLWSTGETTSAINGLWTGIFNVQITDANGCSLSLSANLTIAPDPIATISSVDSVSCFGGNDGTALVAITNGSAPFSISWMPAGGNNLTATALTAGSYTVTVTDALGCQASDSTIVDEPTAISIGVDSVTDVLCNGQNTGSISLNVSGGTGSVYNYSWAPSGSISAVASNLAAGTYTVNVTDQNNCPAAITINIAEPDTLSSTIDSVTQPVCFNGSGNASVFASGGILPYSYSWIPSGDSGSIANNISADTYTVTVTDANGCITTNNVTIVQPSQIITSGGVNDTVCVGQSGTLYATATGGAGNYYYAWQPSSAVTGGTLNITPSTTTTYTVVAYDQLGCSGRADTTSAIVYTLNNLSIQAHATSPVCPGQAAVVYVETSGNTGSLTYQWNNELGNGPGVYVVTLNQPAQYIVTVSNACASVSDTVDILLNPPPAVSFTSDTNELCVPGNIQFSDNSITGNPNDPITIWNWDFGDGSSSNEEDPLHTYTAPLTFPVTLTITTSGGCTNNNSSAPLSIIGHPYPTAAFSVNSTDLSLPYELLNCSNQSAGANSYIWNFGDGGSSALDNPQYLYTSIGVFQIQLVAISLDGCRDTAYTEVTTDADVLFPSAFTPNIQGSSGGRYDVTSLDNNVFFPYTSGVIEYHMQVFNRWGEVIFDTQDINIGWDGYYNGKICQQDVYIWKVFVKLNNGKEFDKNGNVTLLR